MRFNVNEIFNKRKRFLKKLLFLKKRFKKGDYCVVSYKNFFKSTKIILSKSNIFIVFLNFSYKKLKLKKTIKRRVFRVNENDTYSYF